MRGSSGYGTDSKPFSLRRRSYVWMGRLVDVEVAASPCTDLEGQGIQAGLRDITDRKRAEQAVLQLNEQRLIATERERAAQEMARNLVF